jgi:hypothetical protein
VKQFLLELLTIYYYPTIILFIIYLKMIEYIDIIKTTRDKIIDDAEFKTMINSLLTVNIENHEMRAERRREEVKAARAAARAEAGAEALPPYAAERAARAKAVNAAKRAAEREAGQMAMPEEARAAMPEEARAAVAEEAAAAEETGAVVADMVAEAMPEETEANRIRHPGQNENIRHRVGRAAESAANMGAFMNDAGALLGFPRDPTLEEDVAPNSQDLVEDPPDASPAQNQEDPAARRPAAAAAAPNPRARLVSREVIDGRKELVDRRRLARSPSDDEDDDPTDGEDEPGDNVGGTMTGGAFDFNIIKTYNNSPVNNPYLNSSGTMFYNALINFAVSISINNKSEFEELMLAYLKEILIEKFNIIFDENFDNDEELNRVKGEFEEIKKDLDRDTNGNQFIKAYNESKEAKSQLEKLIKDQEKKPTMNIAEYTDQKEDLETKINRSNKIINVAQDLNDKKTSLEIKTKIVKYIDKDKLLEWLKEQSDKTLETRKTINNLLIYMFASPNDNDDKITTTASASASPASLVSASSASDSPAPLVSASSASSASDSPSRASYASRIESALGNIGKRMPSMPSLPGRARAATGSALQQRPIQAVIASPPGNGPGIRVGGSTNDDKYCLEVMRKKTYASVIDKSIVKGIGQSSMFTFLQPAPETTQKPDTSSDPEPDPLLMAGGNRSTRRYKKRRGTRRQQKRKGTHRKRKNTTR